MAPPVYKGIPVADHVEASSSPSFVPRAEPPAPLKLSFDDDGATIVEIKEPALSTVVAGVTSLVFSLPFVGVGATFVFLAFDDDDEIVTVVSGIFGYIFVSLGGFLMHNAVASILDGFRPRRRYCSVTDDEITYAEEPGCGTSLLASRRRTTCRIPRSTVTEIEPKHAEASATAEERNRAPVSARLNGVAVKSSDGAMVFFALPESSPAAIHWLLTLLRNWRYAGEQEMALHVASGPVVAAVATTQGLEEALQTAESWAA